MAPERWKKIIAIFDKVLELNVEQRDSYLDQVCQGDPELRKEIEVLVECDAQAEAVDFLGKPLVVSLKELMEFSEIEKV